MADKFDQARPYGGQKVNIGDDAIRENNRTLKVALELEHEPFDGSEEADGRHKFVTLQDMTGSEPTPAADEMALYSKDADGQPELFVREESTGDIIQITKDGYGYGVLSLLAGSPDLARTMEAVVRLANAIALQGLESDDSTARALIQVLVGDTIEVGDVNVDLAFQAADLANFAVDDGGGAHRILTDEDAIGHESGFDADLLDGVEGAGYLQTPAATVAGVFYKSAATTVAPSGEVLFEHGLGSIPNLFTVVLKCVTAEHGFVAGDEIPCASNPLMVGEHSSNGMIAIADATNIEVRRAGASIALITNASSNYWQILTNNRWKFVVRAWK